ncbi:MAG: response regulator, partial [Firmicutes bacterium]|nr:response regulator [Bacillota bacterium]
VKFTTEGQVAFDISVMTHGTDFCAARFTISDTGIGMSDSFLQKIFKPFEQEDSFLSRRYAGSGLGLSISHNIVTLMGGEMTVDSKLGEGSKFVFTIPFETAKASETVEKTAVQADIKGSLRGKRILLADDIEINREIVLELFADTGAQIEEADNGEEAYQKFADSPVGYYDCVLMDIQMPKMDGYTATRAIRGLSRVDANIPIIAVTANALSEDIEHARASGMNDHIAKPIDFDVCFKTVKQWCGII